MSEDRFNRIDQWQGRADERFDRIEQRLGGVELRLDRLETGQTELQSHMDSRFDELGRYMRVLHEDALDRIAGSRESPRDTSARSATSTEAISRRLDPLEAIVPVVREHEVKLRRHDSEIERLKRGGRSSD